MAWLFAKAKTLNVHTAYIHLVNLVFVIANQSHRQKLRMGNVLMCIKARWDVFS